MQRGTDRPTTEPRPPEVGEFESLHHAVGKALYGWADDEPNAATGAVARMEVAGVVLAVIDWLEARATPAEAAQGAAPQLRKAVLRHSTDPIAECDDGSHHVLSLARNVLAERPEAGSCAHCGQMAPCTERRIAEAFVDVMDAALSEGAAPRAEGLDVDALARDIDLNIAWLVFTDKPYKYSDGHVTSVVRGDAGKRIAEWFARRLAPEPSTRTRDAE